MFNFLKHSRHTDHYHTKRGGWSESWNTKGDSPWGNTCFRYTGDDTHNYQNGA